MKILNGRDVLTFVRAIKDETTQDAAKVRFVTDVSINWEKETESLATMDGVDQVINDGETTLELSSYAYTDDEGRLGAWKDLEKNFLDNEPIAVWVIMHNDPTSPEVEPYYFEGYFSSFDLDASADGQVELSISVAVRGNGTTGEDTLTESQMAVLDALDYEYKTLGQVEEV